MAAGSGHTGTDFAAISTSNAGYVLLADGSLQVFESNKTPGAPSLQRFGNDAVYSASAIPEGGFPTRQDAGFGHDVTPASATCRQTEATHSARLLVRSNMDAPMQASTSVNKSSMFSLYQQQLLATQNMCLAQQSAINSLMESVKELKNSIAGNVLEHRPERSEVESVYENVSSGEESDNGQPPLDDLDYDSSTASLKLQKMGESPADKRVDKLKQINLQFSKQELFSPPVHDVVATTVNKGLASCVDHKSTMLQELVKKYDQPENCDFLQVPKVNKVLWTSKQTAKSLKDGDKLMQRSQAYLTRGLMLLVQIMNKTLTSTSEEAEEVFDLALDSFNLLVCAHRDFSNQRRRFLMPAISDRYKQLCNESASISAGNLFGEDDDLEKTMKNIEDSRKLGNNLSQPQSQKFQVKSQTLRHGSKYEKSPMNRYKPYRGSERFTGKRTQPSATVTSHSFLWKKAQGPKNQHKPQQNAKLGHQGHTK